ncbi:MAG: hypothetical protein IKR22_02215 [Clostridiales bacterium]|nr:hypothetical protein [Clostridiales bacterium]
MKKALAILLSMSMALALFGCGKSEETKKTKKTKKTTDTEITETTEDPYISMIEPSTTESDETSDTSPAPEIKKSVNLHSQVELTTYGLAELINDDNFTRVDGITYEFNRIKFTTDQFPELRKEVDSFYDDLEAALTKRFEDRKASGINSDTYYDDQCYANTYIYRDDSYIFSYIVKTPEDLSSDNDGCISQAYWSETGEEISLSDIVTNDDILSEKITSLGQKYNIPDENLLRMKVGVQSGTGDFALTYDGLVLFDEYYSLKLPFDQIEEGVDSKFFGHAPEMYFVDFNLDGTLKWDMDGDGTAEDIILEPKFENPNDSILVTSVVIHVGSETCEVKEGIWGEFYPQYGSFYLMKAPDTFYIFMSVGIDEGIEEVGYKYENGTWTFTGNWENGVYDHPYDPQRVKMSTYFGNLGTNYMFSYFDLTDGSGMPKHLGDLYYETSYYLATNTDLVFTAYDKSGAPAGDLKVAARTIIQVIAFDTDSNMLYVNVYSGKTGEYGYASIEMQKDDTWKVGGVPVDDAFLGIRYAG